MVDSSSSSLTTSSSNSSTQENDNNGGKNVKTFVRLRQAFEQIRANHHPQQGHDKHEKWSDEEFQSWFYEETGHMDIQFQMNLRTRKEVIDVFNTHSQGGLDRGGMWEMARSMAEQEKVLATQKERYNKPNVRLEGESSSLSSSSSDASLSKNNSRRRRVSK